MVGDRIMAASSDEHDRSNTRNKPTRKGDIVTVDVTPTRNPR